MIKLTEVQTKNEISINIDYLVAIFTVTDGEHIGKTGVSLTNGSIIVDESHSVVKSMYDARKKK